MGIRDEAGHHSEGQSPAARTALVRRVIDAYRWLEDHDPIRCANLRTRVMDVLDERRTLRLDGVETALQQRREQRLGREDRSLLGPIGLILGAPFAALGVAVAVLPYAALRLLLLLLRPRSYRTALVKLLGGGLLFGLWFALSTWTAWRASGPAIALGVGLSLVPLAVFAHRYVIDLRLYRFSLRNNLRRLVYRHRFARLELQHQRLTRELTALRKGLPRGAPQLLAGPRAANHHGPLRRAQLAAARGLGAGDPDLAVECGRDRELELVDGHGEQLRAIPAPAGPDHGHGRGEVLDGLDIAADHADPALALVEHERDAAAADVVREQGPDRILVGDRGRPERGKHEQQVELGGPGLGDLKRRIGDLGVGLTDDPLVAAEVVGPKRTRTGDHEQGLVLDPNLHRRRRYVIQRSPERPPAEPGPQSVIAPGYSAVIKPVDRSAGSLGRDVCSPPCPRS